VTVGTFDGIHLGHQEIFRRVRHASQESNLQPVLITFHPHPRVVVSPEHYPLLLTSIEEKRRFVPHFFDGAVVILHFDEQLRNMTAEDFIKLILVERIGVRKLIVGYDHAFGRNREGSIPALRLLGSRLGFDVEVVDPVFAGGQPVSSSRIRTALKQNQYGDALRLLGHDYAICGSVIRGIGLGRKIGYPTANIQVSHRKLLPTQGVYSCWAEVNGREFDGMLFIGQNHFNPVEGLTVEVNLFDFDQKIYGHEIVVNPTRYIRENRQFAAETELMAQIAKDKQQVLRMISKGEKQCQ